MSRDLKGLLRPESGQITLSVKGLIALVSTVIALAGHGAVLEYRVTVDMEQRIKALERLAHSDKESLHRMEKTLCRMCTHLLPKDDCRVCD